MLGRRCRDLLVHLYLQRPDLRVPVPDVLLHSEGAAGSSVCKVKPYGVIGAAFVLHWEVEMPFLGSKDKRGPW